MPKNPIEHTPERLKAFAREYEVSHDVAKACKTVYGIKRLDECEEVGTSLLWRADVIGFRVDAQVENLVSTGADAETVQAARRAALARLLRESGAAAVPETGVQGMLGLEQKPVESTGEGGGKAAEAPAMPPPEPIDWGSFDPYDEMRTALQVVRDGMQSPKQTERMTAAKQYAQLLERWDKHQEGEDAGEELDAFLAEIEATRSAGA